jgi:hypothetical protein
LHLGFCETTQANSSADKQVPNGGKARFIEVTETQLMSLHEGNIARYRLRPSEFHAWQVGWK